MLCSSLGVGPDGAASHTCLLDTAASPNEHRSADMRVATLEATPVSFPYVHREVSSQVARDGVTDVIVRIETDDGCVGWGEACSGADVVVDRGGDPRDGPVRDRQPTRGTARRSSTSCTSTGSGSSAPEPRTSRGPGSTWRLRTSRRARQDCRCTSCSAACGAWRPATSTTSRAARREELSEQCRAGLRAGFDTFYLKVGVDAGGRSRNGRGGAGGARFRPAAPARRERRVVGPAGVAVARRDGRVRHRLRRAARPT